MSRLRIFNDSDPTTVLLESRDFPIISAELKKVGVVFERWQALYPIAAGADEEEIFTVYRADIDRLVRERGFNSVDVATVAPDNPEAAELRKKFLDEHYHKEDEVRFFIAGSGLFSLHIGDKLYDWFDMGAEPNFAAIRFFTEPDGWVGHFTGSDIASRFPRYEPEELTFS